jgi:hypothetical protein
MHKAVQSMCTHHCLYQDWEIVTAERAGLSAAEIRLLIQVTSAVCTAINWADKAACRSSYWSQHFGHLRAEQEGFSKGESDVPHDCASQSYQPSYKMLSPIFSRSICLYMQYRSWFVFGRSSVRILTRNEFLKSQTGILSRLLPWNILDCTAEHHSELSMTDLRLRIKTQIFQIRRSVATLKLNKATAVSFLLPQDVH